ncbi:MAG: 2-phospho-L-lactate guanylyltransferase [Chloroflexi bacterium]|nr:MAG: 2-phospho-L-lactate guanylyltransferase [Chloroflexota bacterium]
MTAPLRVVGLLPVRRLDDAKGRLGPTVSPEDRAGLALALLQRAICALFDGGVERVAVITRDERLIDNPPDPRLDILQQVDRGLNPAVVAGQRWAESVGADALLIVLPDLPLVRGADIAAVLAAVPSVPGAVLAPDRHNTGSNALLLAPPGCIAPAFGEGSAPAHRAALSAAGVPWSEVRRPGLSLDLDTPDDLARLAELGIDWRVMQDS